MESGYDCQNGLMSTLVEHAQTQQRAVEFHIFGRAMLIRNSESIAVPTGGPRELLALLMLDSGRRTTSLRLARKLGRAKLSRTKIAASVNWLNTALSGTGLAVEAQVRSDDAVRSAWDPPGEYIEIHVNGDPIEVDLDRVLQRIVAIVNTQSMARARELAFDALEIVRNAPLAGVHLPTFTKQRLELEQLREQLAWLGTRLRSILDHRDIQATLEEVLAQFDSPVPTNLRMAAEQLHQAQYKESLITIVEDFEAALSRNPFYPILDILAVRRFAESPLQIAGDLTDLLQQVRAERYSMPVSIFLGNGGGAAEVENALGRLLAEVGLVVTRHKPPQLGSWFRRFRAQRREDPTELNIARVTAELEHKLRNEISDNHQATEAAALIAALQGEDRACIRIGPLLVLKVNGQVLATTLADHQLAWVERNQLLIRDPEILLKRLNESAAESNSDVGRPRRLPSASESQESKPISDPPKSKGRHARIDAPNNSVV
jgi:hypothetical protein